MVREMKSAGERGFTLLEALVATAVLGASVAALLGLLSGALRNAARLEAPERALLLGQSKLNELLVQGGIRQGGASSSLAPELAAAFPAAALAAGQSGGGSAAGTVAPDALPFDQTISGRWDERFRWEARVTRYRTTSPPGAQPRPGELLLARVALDVFWTTQTAGPERKLSFETYQLRREEPQVGRGK